MTVPNPALVGNSAFAKLGVQLAGVPITFNRLSGFAPNVTVVASASVNAIVRTMAPDVTSPSRDGLSPSQPGSLEQNSRWIVLMTADLVNAGITLPVRVGDQVVVADTGETLNVDRIDPYKRAMVGAIELYASAVT